jgi:F-box/leucine-rich repeat protein 2/20
MFPFRHIYDDRESGFAVSASPDALRLDNVKDFLDALPDDIRDNILGGLLPATAHQTLYGMGIYAGGDELDLSSKQNYHQFNFDDTPPPEFIKKIKKIKIVMRKDFTVAKLKSIATKFENVESLHILDNWTVIREKNKIYRPYAGVEDENEDGFMTDDFVPIIAKCFPNLRSLDLSDNGYLTDKGIAYLTDKESKLNNLQSLNLEHLRYLTNESFQAIAERFPKLRSLNVSYTSFTGITALTGTKALLKHLESLEWKDASCILNDDGFKNTIRQCPNLKSLHFGEGWSPDNFFGTGKTLTDDGFSAIAQWCPRLKQLDLTECALTDVGSAIANLTKLTSLCLDRNHNLLGSEALGTIAGLTSLTIMHCDKIQVECILSIVKNCPDLTSLYLDLPGISLTDANVKTIVESCPSLTELDLNACCQQATDAGLQEIASGLPELKKLRLRGCTSITYEGIAFNNKQKKHLQHLDLEGCTNVTTKGVLHIFEQLKNLTYLQLGSQIADYPTIQEQKPPSLKIPWLCLNNNLECLEPKALETIAGLTSLTIKHCANIQVEGILSIVAKCPDLTSLYLDLPHIRLTDANVETIVKSCPSLTALQLNTCYQQATNDGLWTIASGLRKLTTLEVLWCPKITYYGLSKLANPGKLPYLKKLRLTGCTSITYEEITFNWEQRRHLQHLDLGFCSKITTECVLNIFQQLTNLTYLVLGSPYVDYNKIQEQKPPNLKIPMLTTALAKRGSRSFEMYTNASFARRKLKLDPQ